MNKLHSNEKLNTPDSEAYVLLDSGNAPIGSITVSNLVKALSQDGDFVKHTFKRLSKDRKIIEKEYVFFRDDVVKFLDDYATDYAKTAPTNEEFASMLMSS